MYKMDSISTGSWHLYGVFLRRRFLSMVSLICLRG